MRAAPAISALFLAAAVTLGCGQSKADKASDQVCSARSDLQKQVGQLASLTPTTATIDGIKSNLEAIRDDLRKIADAQPDLNAERKQQVQQANQTFKDQLGDVVGQIGKSLSASDAKTQLQDATQALTATYRESFARVDCG